MTGVFRRCGCRDDQGRTYGVLGDRPTPAQLARACPVMVEDPKHGRWSFRISAGFDPQTKKRRQVNGGTYATKREAQVERNKAAALVDRGKVPTVDRTTYAEYLPRWLARRSTMSQGKRGPLAGSTLENYTRYVEQDIASSSLGAMQVRQIRRAHVQAFVDDLVAAGRGAVTVRRIVAVVQGSLRAAVKDELLEDFPAAHLDLPPVDAEEFQPWEPAQVGHFLDVAGEHRLGALFEVAIFTGIRRGALVALEWADVDLAEREIRVRRDKTEAGRRRVALDDRAVGALVAWQIAQAAEREAWGAAYADGGLVFTMEDGRPLKPQYVTRLFEKLRAKAGLPKMTFHGQRHQQASLQLAAGTPLAVVSKRLGHANVSTTADIYSHLLRSTEHDAANAAAALVPPRRVPAHTLHAQGGENEEEAVPAESGNGL
jgi:integrase